MSSHPQADDAMSTASTLVPSTSTSTQPRTTLTGRPIKYEHDSLSNILSGESSHVGANTLPPGYTDSSLVHIPIKTADYLSPTAQTQTETQPQYLQSDVKREQPRKGSVFSRISSKLSTSSGCNSSGKDADALKIVAMSRGDYLKYWAKGEDGKFRDDVVEPPGGRAEWLADAIERQEREGLGKVTAQRTKGTEGRAGAFGAAGALIGGVST